MMTGTGSGHGVRAEVIENRGCSRLVLGFTTSSSSSMMSPFAASSVGSESVSVRTVAGPFSGLVICVTGLSKEARKQVMEATDRLGGLYSPNLHPQCTHLVVQSFSGRKLEHALKLGSRRSSVSVVTLGWFVDSVRRNVRLSESLYNIKSSVGDNGAHLDELNRLVGTENSCLPAGFLEAHKLNTNIARKESYNNKDSVFTGHSIYVDPNILAQLYKKICDAAAREGAKFVDRWFIGCSASHVVCEGISAYKYLGHSSDLVTPLWVLKTVKEKYMQGLTHISADLARQMGTALQHLQNGNSAEENCGRIVVQAAQSCKNKASLEERQQIATSAKLGVRNRRGRRMQTCQIPIRPITPSSLLDSISWSISELTSTASIYIDSISVDGKDSEASFANFTNPLTQSEKGELIFKNHFLTILFPIDRYSEMGPSSRTFFSNNGFTCLQVLDHIYAFYQEKMSTHEIEVAIHSDSRHADQLRSVYCSKETAECCNTIFKRIDFLGSRKSFGMLKRINGDNSSNVYELLVRA